MIWASLNDFFGNWEWHYQTIFFVGLFLTLLAILGRFSPLLRERVKRGKGAETAIIVDEPAMERGMGIEYSPNRSKLPNILAGFANTSEGYYLWYTGYEVRNVLSQLKGKIKKVILIKPNLNLEDERLLSFIKDWGKRPEDVVSNLIAFTKELRNAGVEVRWLEEIPELLTTISNPNADDAWIRIESFDTKKQAHDWESTKVYKKRQNHLYKVLYYEYKLLWEKAIEPPWDTL